jgi:hypothetical protein
LDGIYTMRYRGTADWGMGMLIFERGRITGADFAGGLYDGSYVERGPDIEVRMTMTVPPGVTLVQGTPARPTAYQFPINVMLSLHALEKQQPVLLHLPPGPVNVIFQRLRRLSD